MKEQPHRTSSWRKKIYDIIFEAETPAGKIFDVALLVRLGGSVRRRIRTQK